MSLPRTKPLISTGSAYLNKNKNIQILWDPTAATVKDGKDRNKCSNRKEESHHKEAPPELEDNATKKDDSKSNTPADSLPEKKSDNVST